MAKINTFVIPVLIADNIERCLETIYLYNRPDTFDVVVVDQTVRGLSLDREKYHNLIYLRSPITKKYRTGNLGHGGATNLGAQLVRTPYFTMLNDDVEFIDDRWWQGVMDVFDQVAAETPHTPALMVNPSSARMFGASLGAKEDIDLIPYKEKFTPEDYDFLLNTSHEPIPGWQNHPNSYGDGVMFYAPVVLTSAFRKLGCLNEKYWPGLGNDYNFQCMAYAHNWRCVGTTKSWVWHHFSSTFRNHGEEREALHMPELEFNNNYMDWGGWFTPLGPYCDSCHQPMRAVGNGNATCPCGKSTIPLPKWEMLPL